MTLAIPVWYIDPPANTSPGQLKLDTTLTSVQLITITPPFAFCASGEGGKAHNKEPKEKAA